MNLVLDIDGTLTFDGNKVSDKITKVLCQLMDEGHKVVLASARPIRDIYPVIDKALHQMPLVGGNGSIVANKGHVIYKNTISTTCFNQLIEIGEANNIDLLIDDEWDYGYTGDGSHKLIRWIEGTNYGKRVPLSDIATPIKVLMMDVMWSGELEEALSHLPLTLNRYSKEPMIDVTARGVNKLTGVHQLGIESGDYVCFGNDDNDVVLFEAAKYCVQVGDHPSLNHLSSLQIPIQEAIINVLCETLIEVAHKEI